VDLADAVVRAPGGLAKVAWREVGAALSCVAWLDGVEPPSTALDEVGAPPSAALTSREMESATWAPSVAARLLAKNLVARRLDVPAEAVEIIRPRRTPGGWSSFGPPEVWVEGRRRPACAVSLSHDGAYCAAAVAVGDES
jgi:hypothetical protein